MIHLRNQTGITLVEVLAAMLILAIGILAMAPMMVLSVTGNRFSEDVTTVAAAAQREIEAKIEQGTFASMPFQEIDYVGDSTYRVTSLVTDESVDPNVPANVYEVSVSVNWTDDSGVDRNLSFITYMSKP